MTVETLTIKGNAGNWVIIDSALAFVTVYGVFRENGFYTPAAGVPDGREYRHKPGNGSIEFDSDFPFNDPYEKIIVQYKY